VLTGLSWPEAALALALGWWPVTLPLCLFLTWRGHLRRWQPAGLALSLTAGAASLILALTAMDTGFRAGPLLPY
jgi:hypothetical protein